jgi:hypothetical protein
MGGWRRGRVAPILVIAIVMALPALNAFGALGPLNDLLALGQGVGQQPARVATVTRAEPPQAATPRAVCGPGSKPEPGIQGRVPAGSATTGLHCNVELLAHQGTSGGFKVWRYVDAHGRACAFYDTALLFPVNALKLDSTSQGVAVLDMSDAAHPKQTDTLTELPMLSPHESLNLNAKRGLLAAVTGNPTTYPGVVSIYDVHNDCRHPVLQSTKPVARLGHESGFSPDGRTFWATGTAKESITAVDVTNPKDPHAVWQGNEVSHGMSLSPDGRRAYIADPGGEMLILDVSQIQARAQDPQPREVSRLTWKSASIPQNALPFTDHGKPYVLEFDEYTQGTTSVGNRDAVGAARIIDISDERAPRVIANIRLQVNQPADHAAASGDPGALSPRPGLRGALLQPVQRRRPDRRRVLVHRVGPARVRHLRPAAPEGDRLLRRAHPAARRERLHGERLRDVQARHRARPARDLVLRRPDRLLRAAGGEGRVAGGGGACRLPRPSSGHRPPHRPDPAGDGARSAPRPAPRKRARVALVREGRDDRRRVHAVGPRRAGRHDGDAPPTRARSRSRVRPAALHPTAGDPARPRPLCRRRLARHDRAPEAAAPLRPPRRPALTPVTSRRRSSRRLPRCAT